MPSPTYVRELNFDDGALTNPHWLTPQQLAPLYCGIRRIDDFGLLHPSRFPDLTVDSQHRNAGWLATNQTVERGKDRGA
jgi:hypothetical protein